MSEKVSASTVLAVDAVLQDSQWHTAEQVSLAAELSLSTTRRALERLRSTGLAEYMPMPGQRPGKWRQVTTEPGIAVNAEGMI